MCTNLCNSARGGISVAGVLDDGSLVRGHFCMVKVLTFLILSSSMHLNLYMLKLGIEKLCVFYLLIQVSHVHGYDGYSFSHSRICWTKVDILHACSVFVCSANCSSCVLRKNSVFVRAS